MSETLICAGCNGLPTVIFCVLVALVPLQDVLICTSTQPAPFELPFL